MTSPAATRYLSRVYRVAADREDEVSVLLADQGSLGVEVRSLPGGEIELVAWYAERPEPHGSLPDLPGGERRGVVLASEAWIGDQDWLAEYRRHAVPRRVGRRFLVDPREPGDDGPAAEEAEGCIVLRLPAREAFGTGSHASTRLALAWLEDLPLRGARILDVGCGSGILSLGALSLGAATVIGFDPDRVSAFLAGENGRRHTPGPGVAAATFFAGGVDAIHAGARFDVLLVNVLPQRIAADVPAIAGLVARDGTAVVSGLLTDERDSVAALWTCQGLELCAVRTEEEWAALLLEKRP